VQNSEIDLQAEALEYEGQIADRVTEENFEEENLMDVRYLVGPHLS
jgi:hypothetical protein